MATWQFDLRLVPRTSITRHGLQAEDRLSVALLDDVEWWEGCTLPSDYPERLAAFLPVAKPWSEGWNVFGTEDGTRVDVITAGQRVEEVRMRIDARHVDADIIEHLVAFATGIDALLVSPEGRVFEPTFDAIGVELELSPAALFVRDPAEFFRRLKDRREQ